MNQYVGLLELICSSSSIPTAEMLQDVSVLYARLGRNMKTASLLFQRVPHRFMSHLFVAQLQFCSKSGKAEIMLRGLTRLSVFKQLKSVEFMEAEIQKTLISTHLTLASAPH